ncbi:IniB N-terminal domain-containing protein [Micromonospora sp. 4G55]|nr:IniB N-terminal domain-containing protein [Micromonospora sp. 4G55]
MRPTAIASLSTITGRRRPRRNRHMDQTLHDFVLNLLTNPDAKSAFDLDPEGALQAAGLPDITAADVQDVVPLVVDYAPVHGLAPVAPLAGQLGADPLLTDTTDVVAQLQTVPQDITISSSYSGVDVKAGVLGAIAVDPTSVAAGGDGAARDRPGHRAERPRDRPDRGARRDPHPRRRRVGRGGHRGRPGGRRRGRRRRHQRGRPARRHRRRPAGHPGRPARRRASRHLRPGRRGRRLARRRRHPRRARRRRHPGRARRQRLRRPGSAGRRVVHGGRRDAPGGRRRLRPHRHGGQRDRRRQRRCERRLRGPRRCVRVGRRRAAGARRRSVLIGVRPRRKAGSPRAIRLSACSRSIRHLIIAPKSAHLVR